MIVKRPPISPSSSYRSPPPHAGLRYHRLDNIKDKNFWSGRARRAQV
jgi:hypothetical protein